MRTLKLDLVESIKIANIYHSDQTCRGGLPYVLHPLRVMSNIKGNSSKSYKLRIVAVLHDILEDTGVNKRQLTFLDEDVYKAIEAISKIPGENYEDYLARCKTNYLSRQVKLLDLADNMDMSRLLKVTDKDIERYEKYCRAVRFLED